MKKLNALPLFLAGMMLLFPATRTECDQSRNDLSPRSEPRRIEPVNGGIAVSSREDSVLGTTEQAPAATSARGIYSLPAPVIRYLLPGKGTISGLVWHDLNGNGNPAMPGGSSCETPTTPDPGKTAAAKIKPQGLSAMDDPCVHA